MKILLDQGTAVPLRRLLPGHTIVTAYEMGWAALSNGELLDLADVTFDAMITTDRNLRYQQNVTGRKLAILVLPTTSWPKIQRNIGVVIAALNVLNAGDFIELIFTS